MFRNGLGSGWRLPRGRRGALGAVAIAVVIGLCAGHAAEADDGEANRLFVAAVNKIREADRLAEERPDDRAALYERALRNFERIIAEHPESELAVKLIAGEPIGDITQWGIERRAILARAMTCLNRWDAVCLVRQAETAASHGGEFEDQEWFHRTRALVYAEGGVYQAARAAANEIEEGAARGWALGYVAESLVEDGEREAAILILKEAEGALISATSKANCGNALAAIGAAYARLGDADAAKRSWREAQLVIDALSDANDQLFNRYYLAWHKIDVGAKDEAITDTEWLGGAFAETTDTFRRFAPFFVIQDWSELGNPLANYFLEAKARAFAIQLYAQADRSAEANDILAELEDKLSKHDFLRQDQWLMIVVAEGYAAVGRHADALAIAEQLDAAYEQSLAYSWISGYWNSSQHKDEMLSTFRKALQSADTVEQPGSLGELIGSVAAQVSYN